MGNNFRKGREQGAGTVRELQRVGWAVKRFCDEADISLAMFYKLGPHQRPASVKVGSKRVVIESPAAWLSRMGAEAAAEGSDDRGDVTFTPGEGPAARR
jgi:hypothetical protein